MEKYIPGQDIKLDTDVDEKQFGELEFEALLMTLKEMDDPVLYGVTEGGSVSSEPVIHDGRVYFGCCDRNFYCLDTETGRKVWEFKTGAPIILDSVIHDGVIYFGSFDHNLYAVTLEGDLVWRFDCGDMPGNPGYHDGVVYIGSKNGNLYAVDARTGRQLWKFSTNGPIASKPEVYKGSIYFGSWDHKFYCIDLKGKVRWKFMCGHAAGSATIKGGIIYFSSFDCNIYAMMPDGKLKWKYTAAAPIYSTYRPAISGNTIFFCIKDNCIYAVDTKEGKLRWKFKSGNMMTNVPLIHKGIVYAGSCDGNMYAIEKNTGKELWRFSTPLALFAPPVTYKDRLYFGGGDSRFYCLTLDGKLVWTFKTSLSYPVSIDLSKSPMKKAAEIVWTLPKAKENKNSGHVAGELYFPAKALGGNCC